MTTLRAQIQAEWPCEHEHCRTQVATNISWGFCHNCQTRPRVLALVEAAARDLRAENARLKLELADALREAQCSRGDAAELTQLRAEVERLGEPALLAANKCLLAEFDMLKHDYDQLRVALERARGIAPVLAAIHKRGCCHPWTETGCYYVISSTQLDTLDAALAVPVPEGGQ